MSLSQSQNLTRPPSRVTLARLMVLVAIVAACIAWVPAVHAPILVVPLVVAAVWSRGASWVVIEVAAVIGWSLDAIVSFSELSPGIFAIFFLFFSGLAIAVSWILRLLSNRQGLGILGYLAAPAAGLIGFLLLVTGLDFDLRFALSEPAFQAQAARITSNPELLSRKGRRIGLLWVDRVEERNGIPLFTTGDFLLDDGGLAYIPSGLPPTISGLRFTHYRGPWWIFINRF